MQNKTLTLAIGLMVALAGVIGLWAGSYGLSITTPFQASPTGTPPEGGGAVGNTSAGVPSGTAPIKTDSAIAYPYYQTATEPGALAILGSAQVQMQPDRVKISMTVSSKADTAADAVQKNAAVFADVTNGLTTLGIAREDTETLWYNIYPEYQYTSDGYPILTGYRADHTFQATIKANDTSTLGTKAGQVIDAATQAGVNQISGLQFTVSDEAIANLNREALKLALEDAKQKADLIASTLGVQLTGIQSFSESSYYPISIYRGTVQAAEGKTSTEIIPGSFSVTAQVQVTYTIGPLTQE